MIQRIKQIVQTFAGQWGYRVRLEPYEQCQPIDLRCSTNDPRSLLYCGRPHSILIDAPVEKGRGFGFFSFHSTGPHPFVRAVAAARQNRGDKAVIASVLKDYYHRVRPEHAADWLGLPADANPELSRQPPYARVFPWQSRSITEKRNAIEAITEFQEVERNTSQTYGWKGFGPLPQAIIDIETDRLHALYRSIQQYGLLRDDGFDGDAQAVALLDGDTGEWRWVHDGVGIHRVPALSAMGFATVPIRIWRVVDRRHVALWPQVVRGVFSQEVALSIFDSVFAAQLPPVAKNWY